MQRQQLGGRQHVPVTLGVYHLRAYQRIQQEQRRSCALLFLDLREAFYRVLRPLTLDCPWTDEEVARCLAARLQLPSGIVAELFEQLRGPNAAELAGLPHHVRNYLAALHTDTWFQVEGQSDACRTTVGSRPGDSFADTIFGYLWAKVLRNVEEDLVAMQVLDSFPQQDGCALFGSAPVQGPRRPYLGPCWMDDLAVCVSSDTADGLIRKVSIMLSSLMETCLSHAMTPNVDQGKTELLLTLRGTRSRHWKRHYFGPQSDQLFRALGEHQCYAVRVTGRYKHLGGIIHHSSDQRHEARQRAGQAHQLLTRQKRLLFRNPHISLETGPTL